ncbi:MAG: hypothetical protein D6770_02685 [Anaerolineae bacterium]|nr:MAG: hypothetical protein D6770_02685 [Anaerolineae bacterium]
MGKLIAVVGNTGVGKTTFVRALAATAPFVTGLEQHTERPFQALFAHDPRYALPNQIDYFLLRAEQERLLRHDPRPALVDGGLDVDFYGFTHLFHARGYLSDAEFDLCRRLYETLRACLPPPDLVIHLTAPPDVIAGRLARRDRINIARPEDLTLLASLLDRYLATLDPDRIIRLDASTEDPTCATILPQALAAIHRKLGDVP